MYIVGQSIVFVSEDIVPAVYQSRLLDSIDSLRRLNVMEELRIPPLTRMVFENGLLIEAIQQATLKVEQTFQSRKVNIDEFQPSDILEQTAAGLFAISLFNPRALGLNFNVRIPNTQLPAIMAGWTTNTLVISNPGRDPDLEGAVLQLQFTGYVDGEERGVAANANFHFERQGDNLSPEETRAYIHLAGACWSSLQEVLLNVRSTYLVK